MTKCKSKYIFSQVLNDTEERYKTLQEKVGSLTGESGNIININKKAMEMKSEAEELLDKARKKIDQLRSKSRPPLLPPISGSQHSCALLLHVSFTKVSQPV